jgi:hypothetical protein
MYTSPCTFSLFTVQLWKKKDSKLRRLPRKDELCDSIFPHALPMLFVAAVLLPYADV